MTTQATTALTGTIRDFLHTNTPLVFVDETTPLKDACGILHKQKISALPIFDNTKQQFVGLVDATDICLFVVSAYNQRQKSFGGEALYEHDVFQDVKAYDLLQIADEGKLGWCFSPDNNVLYALESFCKGIHRGFVDMNEGHSNYRIISQRDAVKYLFVCPQYASIFNKHIKDLQLLSTENQPPLATVNETAPAVEGFMRIGREHYGAVAVVDNNGKIVASLRAADLCGCADTMLRTILLPTNLFLKAIHAKSENNTPPPLTAHAGDTLRSVVERILENNNHHAWLVDDQGKLAGVITLSDVCRVAYDLISTNKV